ncbi:hypothetical protein IPZ58_06895 [Streptomyces roseoverticillatus]|uniref:hypothetical protein n=1 Tax=Streptomyces roseoverticillatus TaxID=66429 RepID=UPI001F31CD4B|nr:hypothetical protein [Streptomyces roseoverticillatus]MCF3101304.1 hypothetical protein [Streptomyces roseoverticillatus]
MRKNLLAAAAVVTAVGCLTLTACNDDDAKSGGAGPSQVTTGKPATSPATPQSTVPSVPSASADGPKGAALAFGESSRTVGAGTVGILEITPATVVYAQAAGRVTPQHGTFAVVTLLEKSLSANPADEEAPAKGGGWRWVAADGQSVPAGNGNAAKVVLEKYRHSGGIAPGASQVRAKVFDLTPAQARGGTIVYTDGTKSDDRWKVPAVDTGPQVAEVKQQLKP